MLRGFGFAPVWIDGGEPEKFQNALVADVDNPFFILKTEKGESGPNRHHDAHQIPLKNPATDDAELRELEDWLKSYHFEELFDKERGFTI